MASEWKGCKSIRSWTNGDSLDDSDLRRLYDAENVKVTKPVKCVSYWSFYVILIAIGGLFLFGILVGVYVRESADLTDGCSADQRLDGLDRDKMAAVHHDVMYFMSGQSVGNYYRKLTPLLYPLQHPDWDRLMADNVEGELRKLNPDIVDVEDHNVVVTYPDPSKPNQLRIVDAPVQPGNVTHSRDKGENSMENTELSPFVVFSPSGNVQGKLVYCNYGQHRDFLRLKATNISVKGAVVLVRLGQIEVSEKAKWAEKFGAAGMLLFCLSKDCGREVREMAFYSAADFTAPEDEIYPRIPIKYVQEDTARMLLQNIPTTSLPHVWKTSLQKLLNIQHSIDNAVDMQVRLTVNNRGETKRVRNIIATIPGSMESDRYVMVGASRDSPSNTALLLELLRSLLYIRETEGWSNRRGIQIVSWGGSKLSNFGKIQHIKNHRHVLYKDLVTYIDLDLSDTGSDVMKTTSSPSLISLIRVAAAMVPDPSNTELSLADSWPVVTDTKDFLNKYPARSYHGNPQQNIMVNQLGVSTVTMLSPQIGDLEVSQNLVELDLRHHFKYHLSSARVAALVLLKLVDQPLLPYDVERYTEFVRAVSETSLKAMQRFIIVSQNLTAEFHRLLNNLQDVGAKFTRQYLSKPQCLSALDARKINNILSQLDSIFMERLTNHGSPSYLLTQDEKTGLLSVFTEAIAEYNITQNMEPVKNVIETFTLLLQQTIETLSTNHNAS